MLKSIPLLFATGQLQSVKGGNFSFKSPFCLTQYSVFLSFDTIPIPFHSCVIGKNFPQIQVPYQKRTGSYGHSICSI